MTVSTVVAAQMTYHGSTLTVNNASLLLHIKIVFISIYFTVPYLFT